ncbi:hypothetical protein CMI37_33105 [Candidatus Pacearchaeota archaeon]|nr:hypothetical protein [Candidatus Pacearchaeota archaeon]
MGMNMDGGMHQVQTISPPIASYLDEAKKNSRAKPSKLSQETLKVLQDHLRTPKNPQDYESILKAMKDKGYSVTRRDIDFTRALG